MIVSREITEKLYLYIDLLKKWHIKFNLISERTFFHVWERHILDSAQAYSLVPEHSSLVDVGTGAGFPGLVLSIMGLNNVCLVEPNQKKAIFLQEAIRLTRSSAILYNCRIENLLGTKFEFVISRAVTSIEKFLELTHHVRLLNSSVICFKGASFQKELDQALKKWHFDFEIHPSLIHQKGKLILLSNIQNA